MDSQCPQVSTNGRRNLHSRLWLCLRNVLSARRIGVRSWYYAAASGFALCALFAGLFIAIGARAQPIAPQRLITTPTQSVYLIDGISPYTEECTLDGVSTVDTLPPGLIVEYAKPDAFCTSDGNGNGRLTLLVTGKCRIVRWQGSVIESPCMWLPVVVTSE